jgi:N-methylhydantoinase B
VHIGDLGLCYLDSIELDELRYPIRVHARRILRDSEGAGRFRFAPAGFCEYGPVDTSLEAWFASDGTVNAPLGICGGLAGGRSAQFKRCRDGRLKPLEPCGGVVIQPCETIVAYCCGGGGYGEPCDRAIERVREDVAEGWISAERARELYGVGGSGE